VDKRYEAYCLTDQHFYDVPVREQGRGGFARARSPAPRYWTRHELDDWLVLRPDGLELPVQGWKIHASACMDDAEAILDTVWDYCVPRRIPFKFLPGRETLFLANAKYAHRGSSGKFVTVYPEDEDQCERVLTELGGLLKGRDGPYILSDLRWADGPLHIRYGAFADRYCVSPEGTVEQAVEDPSGRLVPDVRGPVFRPPPWVRLPPFLEPHLAARAAMDVTGLPYRIDKALHFSNGGGLYAAQDLRTGERVVLKEARPYAGLTPDGADAVTRLHREREALERLRGLDCVPELRDHFELGGHHFLVEEFIEGPGLHTLMVQRSPLTALEPGATAFADYTDWALGVIRQVEEAVAAVHERGLVIGDVHTFNILVRPDGRVALIDFEGASDVADARHQTLAAPGFLAPEDATGFDIDRYALACLRLFLFMPLTGLIELDAGKAAQLARETARLFPVPRPFLDEAVRRVSGDSADGDGGIDAGADDEPRLEPDHAGWLRARDSITAGILADATPHRDDRLFPGDIEQFTVPGGGLNLAHGAAGVLYALDVTGAGRRPDHEDWLIRRAMSPQPGTRFGLYNGLHGIAYVLEHFGHHEEAVKILDRCLDERWEQLTSDLKGGLSGIGLNLVHFTTATGDPAYRDAALRAAEVVADRLGPADGVPEISGGTHPRAGLMYGSAGPALLFLRLYEHDGDPAYLDLAATALRQDLRRCVRREDGSMDVNEGFRTMPYLADGSVGIGLVLDEYLAHRDDERFTAAADAIRRTARAPFYLEPGLFDGVAGMILHLGRAHPPGTAVARDPVIAEHVRHLARYAVLHDGHLVFPGEQLMRLSTDLATGSAGVLLALGAAFHGRPAGLPFLTAAAGTASDGTASDGTASATQASPVPTHVTGREVRTHVAPRPAGPDH
jgi:serine/threonine protein kinase